VSAGILEREHARESIDVIEIDTGAGWRKSNHKIWRLAIAEVRGLAVGVRPVLARVRRVIRVCRISLWEEFPCEAP
jgi:hypothetical protein